MGFVSFDSRSEAEAAKNALNVSVVPSPRSSHAPAQHKADLVMAACIANAFDMKKEKKKKNQLSNPEKQKELKCYCTPREQKKPCKDGVKISSSCTKKWRILI